MSFADLKKKRNQALDKLKGAAETQTSKQSYQDNTEWKPTVDNAGNGFAVIRFLPAAEGQDLPWARYWDHAFKGPSGRWYIEKSLTTLKQPDPVTERNSELWNSGVESDKKLARERKRRLHYVSNILVIQDNSNPENEGKVFKFVYGKKIFDKIQELMAPEFEDETPVNPFDMWEGANFKLKIRNVEGYRNYDKSEFDKPSALLDGDDAKLEAVYNQLHDLSAYEDPTTFKTYEELQKKFLSVIGEVSNASPITNDENTEVKASKFSSSKPAKSFVTEDDEEDLDFGSSDSSGDADADYFAKLAEED